MSNAGSRWLAGLLLLVIITAGQAAAQQAATQLMKFPNNSTITLDSAYALHSEALADYNDGKYLDAARKWSEVLGIYEQNADSADLVITLGNIGLCFENLRDQYNTLYYYRQAFLAASNKKVTSKLASAAKTLIYAYQAVNAHKRALDIARLIQSFVVADNDTANIETYNGLVEKLVEDSLTAANAVTERLTALRALPASDVNGRMRLAAEAGLCYQMLAQYQASGELLLRHYPDFLASTNDSLAVVYLGVLNSYYLLERFLGLTPLDSVSGGGATQLTNFNMTELTYLSKDSAVAVINGGWADGVFVGGEGRVMGRYYKDMTRHGSFFVATTRVLSVDRYSAVVGIKIKKTDDYEKLVFITDILDVPVYVPQAKQSVFRELSMNDLMLISVNGYRMNDYSFIHRKDSPELEAKLLRLLVHDSRETELRYRDAVADDSSFTTPAASGLFAGKSILKAMAAATESDILAFLRFIRSYPAKHIGNNSRFWEPFVNWISGGGSIDKQQYREMLLALKHEKELKPLVERLRENIIDYDLNIDVGDDNRKIFQKKEAGTDNEKIRQYVLKVAELMGTDKELANAWFNEGSILRAKNMKKESIPAYKNGIPYYTRLKSRLDVAELHHNIGLSYQDLDQYALSVKHYDTCIAIKRQLIAEGPSNSLYETMASSLWGKAYSIRYQERYDDAIIVYREAVAFYDSSSSSDALENKITVMRNIGEIYEAKGDYRKAIKIYEEVFPLTVQTGNTRQQAKVNNSIAFCLFELGNYAEAISFYTKGYELYLKIGDMENAGFSKSNIGQAYWNLGDYEKAIMSHQQAITLKDSAHDVSGLAFSWNKLGTLYKDSGDPNNAITAFTKSLDYAEAVKDTAQLAETMQNLGDLYMKVKDLSKAFEYYEKAIDKRKLKNDKFKLADAYFQLGNTYWEYQKYDKAYEFWKLAYDIQSDIGDRSNIVYSMANIGLYEYTVKKDFKQAEKTYLAALQLSRETDNQNNMAYCFNKLGGLFSTKGDLEESKKCFDSTLYYYTLLGDKAKIAASLVDVGYYYITKGDFPEGKKYLQRAVVIADSSNNRLQIASANAAIGELYQLQGEYKKALALQDSTMKIYESVNNAWGIAGSYINFGNIYNHMSEFNLALENYGKADSIYAALGDEFNRATPINNSGTIYFWQGDNEEAMKKFLRVEEILAGKDLWNEFRVIVQSNIGEVLFEQKKYDSAMIWLNRALSMGNKMGANRILVSINTILARLKLAQGKFDEGIGFIKSAYDLSKNLQEIDHLAEIAYVYGKLLYSKKDFAKAIPYLEESIKLSKSIGSLRYLYQPLLVSSLILKDQNQPDRAITNLKEAVLVVEAIRAKVVGGEKAQKLFSAGDDKSKIYETLISLYIQKNEIDSALLYLDRSNNEALKQQFGKMEVKFDDESKNVAIQKEKELKTKVDGIDNELEKEKSKPESQRNKDKIESLEKSRSIAEKEYVSFINETVTKDSNLAKYFSKSVNPTSFLRSKKKIPADVAVLAYLMGENQLYVFVASRDTVMAKVVEVPKAVLEKKVVKMYRLLKEAGISKSVGDIDPVTFLPKRTDKKLEYDSKVIPMLNTGAELYEYLIAPVKEQIAAKKKLSIIPYGKLYYLPFETLVEKENGGFKSFVGEEYSVFYISTLDMFTKKGEEELPDIKVMAFGNADNSLPKAEIEVKDIKDIYTDAEVYLREQATKDKVKMVAENFNAIHFATHGNLDYTDIRNSYLTMATNKVTGEDGKLTIEEIWTLTNLNDYNLVTLSACKTAVSDEVITGWMVNPANAFFDIGVKTVIASLWQVDDEATALLMREFYQNLKTMNKVEALKQAKLKLAGDPKYCYPYYWAPFVLVGDYQ